MAARAAHDLDLHCHRVVTFCQPMAKTVLAALPGALLRAAASLGHDAGALAREAGIDLRLIEDPDARVSFATHTRLWQALASLGGDVGVDLGERIGAAALGVVGHALAHAETVGEAFACVTRYRRLVLEDAVPKLTISRHDDAPGRAVLTQIVPEPFTSLRHPAECQVTATLTLVRALVGERVEPLAVALPHPRRASTARVTTALGARITWSAPAAVLELDAGLLARPLRRADDALYGYLARRAESLLADVHDERTSEATRRALVELLPSGAPTAERVARRLGLGLRTLHRRLAEDGTSLTALLDDVRSRRAQAMLADGALGIGQIAHALGYAEHAAFTRAFRRWTGESPEQHRRRVRG